MTSAKEELALTIASNATFEELDKGYYFTNQWEYQEDEYGDFKYCPCQEPKKREWISMDQPRIPSYRREEWRKNWLTCKSKLVQVTNSCPIDNQSSSVVPPVEHRGITLTQLRAVVANITRRCSDEKWTNRKGVQLTPSTVTLYDVDKYIIRPYTVSKKQSFVSCLPSASGKPQPPRFFVSHWWGESVLDFVSCIEQFVRDFGPNLNDELNTMNDRGGGMTADTPIWICAYANNQWELEQDITDDPKKSGFTRALQVANGRTITILDKKGIVFSRI